MIGCLRRTPGKSWQVLEVLLLCQIELCSPWFQQWLLGELLSLFLWFGPPENSRGLRAVPVVGAFGVPPWCGCLQAGGDRSCSAGKGSFPSRLQMVQAGQFLAALTHGWSGSKAVGDANLWDTGSPALPEPAPHSGWQQQPFWLYLGVPCTAASPSMGRGIHLRGGGVPSMGGLHP